MEIRSQFEDKENVGYLIVKVSTARGAIPLEDAAVSIKASTSENSGIVFSLETNADGLTPKITLPAPPRILSESPSNAIPFSSWNIDVFKDGYIPVSFQNVPVYSSVVSIQPAVMIPISENFRPSQRFNESQAPNL